MRHILYITNQPHTHGRFILDQVVLHFVSFNALHLDPNKLSGDYYEQIHYTAPPPKNIDQKITQFASPTQTPIYHHYI